MGLWGRTSEFVAAIMGTFWTVTPVAVNKNIGPTYDFVLRFLPFKYICLQMSSCPPGRDRRLLCKRYFLALLPEWAMALL
jgi:hypothetical protein